MNPSQKAFPVSWDQFHRDCKALAWRLAGTAEANGPWKAIVSITRGGLVPAAIIARERGIRIIETMISFPSDLDLAHAAPISGRTDG